MMKNSKTDREAMSPAQVKAYCREAITIWLREFANRIETGEVDAFDLKWSHDAGLVRPLGAVQSDPAYMPATLPNQNKPKTPEPQAEVASTPETARQIRLSEIRGPIMVEDMTQALAGLKKCEDPNCPNCKNKG
jgi:hypothetical protein